MTAAGDAVLAWAYTQVGVTESPAGSNNVPYWDPWGGNYGAWCAAFVSYADAAAGYPLPPIDGPPGFSYCPSGQIAAFTTGHSVGEDGAEPGDTLIFSWEPWYYGPDGIAYCSSGVYAGAPAGDHTGFFAGWAGDGYMITVEGNTSQSSWDNGGAVMERTDRHTGQICCYARHAALGTGGGPGPEPPRGWLDMLTDEQQTDLFNKVQAIYWMVGNMDPSAEAAPNAIGARVGDIHHWAQAIYWMVGNLEVSAENTPNAIGSRVEEIQRLTRELHQAL